MKLSPRYDCDALINVDMATDPVPLLLAQRERLHAALTALTPEQWDAQSRCAEWSVRDVVTHLSSTDKYWAYSISAGLEGSPSRLLAGFDPAVDPATMVASAGTRTHEEALADYASAFERLADVARRAAEHLWDRTAEAPPGHQAVGAVVLHALWDGLIHERDILVPLGIPTADVAAETLAALRYVAALSPAFAVTYGGAEPGTTRLHATDLDVALDITVTPDKVHVSDAAADTTPPPVVLRAEALAMLEGLSVRAPLPFDVPESHRWLVVLGQDIGDTR